MAKVLRYGKKTAKPDRTLATVQPRTVATVQGKQLAKRDSAALFPSERAARSGKGGSLSTYDANGNPIGGRGTAGKAGKEKSGGASGGGTMANRTDEEDENGSETAERKGPKGVIRSSVVVQMLMAAGMSQDQAEEMAMSAQLSQDNPRVSATGTASRRDGGTGFGRGGSGGTRRAKPSPRKKAVSEQTELALPSSGSKPQPLALPSSGSKPQPLALPSSGSKPQPLALPSSGGKPPGALGVASDLPPVEAPPSLASTQARGILRRVEQALRNFGQPPDVGLAISARRDKAVKKAAAEGEIGKAIDALVANRIEFETPEERAQTFSWLERMIRKIQ